MKINEQHIGRQVRGSYGKGDTYTIAFIGKEEFIDEQGRKWLQDVEGQNYWQLVEEPKPKLLPSERIAQIQKRDSNMSWIDAAEIFLDAHAEVFK